NPLYPPTTMRRSWAASSWAASGRSTMRVCGWRRCAAMVVLLLARCRMLNVKRLASHLARRDPRRHTVPSVGTPRGDRTQALSRPSLAGGAPRGAPQWRRTPGAADAPRRGPQGTGAREGWLGGHFLHRLDCADPDTFGQQGFPLGLLFRFRVIRGVELKIERLPCRRFHAHHIQGESV